MLHHLGFKSTFFLLDFQRMKLKGCELAQANGTAPETDEALTVFQLQPCGQTAEAESQTDSWKKAKHRGDVEELRLSVICIKNVHSFIFDYTGSVASFGLTLVLP